MKWCGISFCLVWVPLVKVFRARQTDDMSLLFSASLLKYNFFAFLTIFLYCVPFYILWTLFLSFFSRSRIIFLFSQGGSLECFNRLWRIGACLLTTSINSLYHTAKVSLGSVCWCTLSNGVQIRSAKNAFWSKGNVCMSFGFWFWQFDGSGAVDRVMVTNTLRHQ